MIKCMLVGSSGIIGSHIKKIPNIKFIFVNRCDVDLSDLQKTKKLISKLPKVDILIFLVGLAHSKGGKNDFNEYKRNNYNTLQNLLSALRENESLPKKIIFSSSISVYGERKDVDTYHELIKEIPKSPYAITKKMAENYLLDNFKINSWILRFAPVYSSGFRLNIIRRTKIINLFYRVGNPGVKLSLCNVNNINLTIEGIVNNNVPPGVYNISDENEYTYTDLLKWQNPSFIIPIPKLLIIISLKVGIWANNNFLFENSIKLLTDNLYPSNKIRNFIDLPLNLYDIKFFDV